LGDIKVHPDHPVRSSSTNNALLRRMQTILPKEKKGPDDKKAG